MFRNQKKNWRRSLAVAEVCRKYQSVQHARALPRRQWYTIADTRQQQQQSPKSNPPARATHDVCWSDSSCFFASSALTPEPSPKFFPHRQTLSTYSCSRVPWLIFPHCSSNHFRGLNGDAVVPAPVTGLLWVALGGCMDMLARAVAFGTAVEELGPAEPPPLPAAAAAVGLLAAAAPVPEPAAPEAPYVLLRRFKRQSVMPHFHLSGLSLIFKAFCTHKLCNKTSQWSQWWFPPGRSSLEQPQIMPHLTIAPLQLLRVSPHPPPSDNLTQSLNREV